MGGSLNFNGNTYDESGNGNDGTVHGTTLTPPYFLDHGGTGKTG